MLHHYADDGRILTPPKELEPLLKGSFPAFSKLLGHIRFFYMADEIWDGKFSLVFSANSEQLTAITLGDGFFYVHSADEDFRIADETLLETIFEVLKKTVPFGWRRPFEQLTINLNDQNENHCGYRCDMCLLNKKHNENNFSGSLKFGYLNWLCYHNCVPNINVERNDNNTSVCPGCKSRSPAGPSWKNDCRYFVCPTEKGFANCFECGEYHSCDVQRDSHYPGQCNLGLTTGEVTSLVIPYCIKERLDTLRKV
jgi:hypothetical protein